MAMIEKAMAMHATPTPAPMPMPSSAEPRRDLGVRGGASPAASVVVATSSDPSAEPEDPAASRAIAWMVGEGPVATLPPRASSPTNPLAHGARTGGAADGLRRRRGRSEERRVGKEGVRTGRYRWWTEH